MIWKQMDDYYYQSDKRYRICKTNGRFAASDNKKQFIGIADFLWQAKKRLLRTL